MIDRFDHHSAHVRDDVPCQRVRPALPLANIHVDRRFQPGRWCETVLVNSADFAERHFRRARSRPRGCSGSLAERGAARNLTAAAGAELDVVNVGAKRNRAKEAMNCQDRARRRLPASNFGREPARPFGARM